MYTFMIFFGFYFALQLSLGIVVGDFCAEWWSF
jgi:hypothetical protein